jgi:hypothetical protein
MDDLVSNISATDIKLVSQLMKNTDTLTQEDAVEILSPLIGLPQTRIQPMHTIIEELESEEQNVSAEEDFEDLSDSEDFDHKTARAQTPKPQRTNQFAKSFGSQTIYNADDFNDIDVTQENKNIQIRREKQEILFQLLKMYPDEAKGQWNMEMPLFELKYELKRRKEHNTEKDQIYFIKQVLKMILVGIEYGNKKLGPILELDGWAHYVTEDMSKYDRCITAVYRRYFKRKQMDPIVEFMWLLIGSMIMWHVQGKYLGGHPRRTSSASDDITPPPGDDFAPKSNPMGGLNLASMLNLFPRK